MLKLACFDLDDTLIRHMHSVMFLCVLHGKEQEHALIQRQEEMGLLDYQTADHQRARLVKGLDASLVNKHFLSTVQPLLNIAKTIQALHASNILSVVITVGPRQVAEAAQHVWGLDTAFGSDYEVVGGQFTGTIRSYVDGEGKVQCLQQFLSHHGITPKECVAIGDGSTDIPLFQYCGKSIAINALQKGKEQASCYIDTDDLFDILPLIL